MDATDIRQVVQEVFGRNTKTEVSGAWVRMRCPLARWTHASGADSNPSAGISIKRNGVSVFSCFTCGNSAPLHGMLSKYAKYTGEDLSEIIGELEDEAYLGPRTMPEWGTRREIAEEDQPLDKAIFMDLYEPAAGHPYLVKRGISDATADRLQLMLDPHDLIDGEERILFPVFGLDEELYGFSGRATNKHATLKVRDYLGLRKGHNVLGAHLFADGQQDKLLLTEGLFDYAMTWENGFPGVAVMHSSLTVEQARIVRAIGRPTYLFYDRDEAGEKGCAVAREMLGGYVALLQPVYPDIWLEDPEEEGGGHYLKDPGDLLPEEQEEMVREARLY